MTTLITQIHVEALAAQFQGVILQPGDPDYDVTRKIWNAMIDRYPAIIARCTGTADVMQAVNFARENGMLISVRGGGHNVAGNAVVDDGLMIDLSPMRGIHIDASTQTARVQPGINWAEFDREAQVYGLAVPGGIVSDTGVAGLTLGGGFGWLTRKYGFTVDSLLSVDVVTADGQVVTASETENVDLFWAVRGGAGNFGIVVSFEFQLYPIGTQVLAGPLIYRLEDASEALRFFREFTQTAPRELGIIALFRTAPTAPFIPEPLVGTPILAIIPVYAGDLEEGARVLQPLREHGNPLFDGIGIKSYIAQQKSLDPGQPRGHRYFWKSEYIHNISDEAIGIIIRYASHMTSPSARLAIFQLGGAVQDRDEFSMAVSHRDAEYVVAINNGWIDAAEDDKEISWTYNLWSEIRPFSKGGVYVNFLSQGEGPERVRYAYGERKYQRLVELKKRYDPENLFRLNQNIPPTG